MLLVTLILALATLVHGQDQGQRRPRPAQPKLQLTGSIQKIEILSEKNDDELLIHLSLTLTNTGSGPMIFLQPEPTMLQATIERIDEDWPELKNSILAHTRGWRSSHSMEVLDWQVLQTALDRPRPPKRLTRTLGPGERFEFDRWIGIPLPHDPNHFGDLSRESESLGYLLNESALKLFVRVETWTLLWLYDSRRPLSHRSLGRQAYDFFAKQIRHKWRPQGHVWTKKVTSEPIALDLQSAVRVDRTTSEAWRKRSRPEILMLSVAPLKFSLDGEGMLRKFEIREVRVRPGERFAEHNFETDLLWWQLTPFDEINRDFKYLLPLVYGVRTPNLQQIVPETEIPRPLPNGRLYRATVTTTDEQQAHFYFTMHNGRAVKVDPRRYFAPEP
jgi:hypothetical protein